MKRIGLNLAIVSFIVILIYFNLNKLIIVETQEFVESFSKQTNYFIKNVEELESTKFEPIIDANQCSNVYPVSVFIHSAAQTSGQYFLRRQTIRETWLSDFKDRNISVYFVLGLNEDNNINEELKKEALKYEDIIQFSFIDSYHNLTLKAISILRWINRKCLTSTYILKTDDDVVVNIENLLKGLPQMRNGIIGNLYYWDKPQRESTNEHYMPYEYYSKEFYPNYSAGNSYLMVGNITGLLLDTIDSYSEYTLFIDDLFITGIIAEKAGIERYSTDLFKWYHCRDICELRLTLAITQDCRDTERLKNFWYEFKRAPNESCATITRRRVQHLDLIMTSLIISLTILCIILFTFGFCLGYFGAKKRYYSKSKYLIKEIKSDLNIC